MMEKWETEAYQRLATAIVETAMVDYVDAAKKMVDLTLTFLSDNSLNNDFLEEFIGARKEFVDCKKFFKSNYFASICSLNGKQIMKALDGRVTTYGSQRVRK